MITPTEKRNTRIKTEELIRKGKIKKQPCAVCGSKKVQCHHNNYLDPMDVKWLCDEHHLEIHGKKKDNNPKSTKTIQIMVDIKFYNKIKDEAKRDSRTVSNYCLVAIYDKLKKEIEKQGK